MKHDPLIKLLLRTFFVDVIELLFPEVNAFLDRSSIEFIDKEIFTGVAGGQRHEVDLIVKAKFKGQETYFLIHIESQGSAQSWFPLRMFEYFAILHLEHGLPVYPIAFFTYATPKRAEPDRYRVVFPDRTVLDFSYRVIQLNRLNWRDFIRKPNPVAAALMTRMKIDPKDRPRVKLECVRMIATLKLTPAKSSLIRQFVDSYLQLSGREVRQYNRQVKAMPSPERESVMEVMNEWEAIGEKRGQERGRWLERLEVLLDDLRDRFKRVPKKLRTKLDPLSLDELKELRRALDGCNDLSDVERWIDEYDRKA